LSALNNTDDSVLQSQPPSQDYLTPPDTALLRRSFPQLLQHFSEADAVKLMLLGLRDCDAVGCIEHGVKKNSQVSASLLNPVDAVFRMAADMSAVDFDQAAQRIETSKKKAEEGRLKAEAEVNAVAAAFRRRCLQAVVVACVVLLIVVLHRAGRLPARLRRLLAAFLLWRRWR
jgi:hypothetical protein